MRTIQGPGLYVQQFIGDAPPFNTLGGIAGWAAELGFKGLQAPTHEPHIFDLGRGPPRATHTATRSPGCSSSTASRSLNCRHRARAT